MQGDDHTNVVERVKASLVTRGVDLAGPCGAYEITRRVAWLLRDEGIGELDKPGGENCRGRAVGFLVYRDGTGIDNLGDAGGANIPQWNQDNGPSASMAERWRAPADPRDERDVPAPAPTPTPVPAPTSDESLLLLAVETLDRIAAAVVDIAGEMQLLNERLSEIETNGLKLRLR